MTTVGAPLLVNTPIIMIRSRETSAIVAVTAPFDHCYPLIDLLTSFYTHIYVSTVPYFSSLFLSFPFHSFIVKIHKYNSLSLSISVFNSLSVFASISCNDCVCRSLVLSLCSTSPACLLQSLSKRYPPDTPYLSPPTNTLPPSLPFSSIARWLASMDSNSNSHHHHHHHHMQHGQQQEEGGGGGKAGSAFLCRQSSTRWIPTSDQIRILRDLYYNSGLRSPNADQIQRISARLRQYGKIEGKNVFYWFQNHKARERQKKRLTMDLAAAAASSNDTCTKTSFPTNRMCSVAGQSVNDGGFEAALFAEPNFKDHCVPGRVPAGSATPPPPTMTWMHPWHASATNAEMSARGIETLQLFPISTLKEEVEEEEQEQEAAQEVENYYYYASNAKINAGQCLIPSMHYYSNPSGGQQRAEEPHLYDLNGAAVDSLELTLNSYGAENPAGN